jgi:hypothetical protein
MKYRLVLQWPAVSEADYDRLICLEELIEGGLGDIGIVDGHDIGSGEMNIFVHTDNPKAAFEQLGCFLLLGQTCSNLKAGYRDFEEDQYAVVYPDGLKRIATI